MSAGISLSMQLEAKAQAYVISYDAKFQKAMAVDGPGLDYLAPYTYEPSINPGVHLVRLPIPLSAPELKAFKGSRHFRKNSTAFIDMTASPFDDGVSEDADKLAAMDWVGFSSSPESIATIIKTWKSRTNAVNLNSGETFTDWTGGNFLSATKYANPFKRSTSTTFKNYWTSAVLKLFASSALYPDALSVCLDERLANGATNPVIKYKMDAEAWPHLSAKRWGIIQTGSAMDTHPVFGALMGSVETLVFGKDSAMYERSNKMGFNAKVRLGSALMRYEAISVAVAP